MRELKVLLVQHPTPRTAFNVPLGLGYLGAVLKSKGLRVDIIDSSAPYADYDNEKIAKKIEKENYDLIGLTITTFFAVFAYDLMSAIKNQKKLVVVGGPHVTLRPHEPFEYGASISVKGEAEGTIAEIADYLKGEMKLSEISGISYLDESGEVIDNPERRLSDDLDILPFPAKDLFNYDEYIRYKEDISKFANILTSRGCPGRCSFCSKVIFGKKYRFRSPKNIISEIKSLNKAYNIKHFSFIDDAMTCNSKRIDTLCDFFQNNLDFKLTWDCVTRIDFVNIDLLTKMHKSGCLHINYGIESANPQTLKKIKKDNSIENIENTLFRTKEAGINYSINFMWGYPWESADDIENSITFMKRISRESEGINSGGILVPFPETEIYESFKDVHGFENWWLNRNKFTGKYRILIKSPMFRYFFFDDQGILEGNGFFNYSEAVKKRIKKAVYYIGNFNLKKQSKVYYVFGSIFIIFSHILYGISYKLESLLQKIFFYLRDFKHRGKSTSGS